MTTKTYSEEQLETTINLIKDLLNRENQLNIELYKEKLKTLEARNAELEAKVLLLSERLSNLERILVPQKPIGSPPDRLYDPWRQPFTNPATIPYGGTCPSCGSAMTSGGCPNPNCHMKPIWTTTCITSPIDTSNVKCECGANTTCQCT